MRALVEFADDVVQVQTGTAPDPLEVVGMIGEPVQLTIDRVFIDVVQFEARAQADEQIAEAAGATRA